MFLPLICVFWIFSSHLLVITVVPMVDINSGKYIVQVTLLSSMFLRNGNTVLNFSLNMHVMG